MFVRFQFIFFAEFSKIFFATYSYRLWIINYKTKKKNKVEKIRKSFRKVMRIFRRSESVFVLGTNLFEVEGKFSWTKK